MKLFPLLLAFSLSATNYSNANTLEVGPAVVLINCGSPTELVDDKTGNQWKKDDYFDNGIMSTPTTIHIEQTENDALYQTRRVWFDASTSRNQPPSSANESNVYDIPMPYSGPFIVQLHFAETLPRHPAPIMNIFIEDKLVYENLNVMEAAGGAFTALALSTTAMVRDQSLTISFVSVYSEPFVSAIAVYEFQTEPIVMINVGGRAYTDSRGNHWQADGYNAYFEASKHEYGVTLRTDHSIDHTNDAPLYQSARAFRRSRPGPFLYEIPVPRPGDYLVTLHFCELEQDISSRRVLNVWLEGILVHSSLDIVQEAGGIYTAWNATSHIYVSDSALSLELGTVQNNPKLSAIAVHLLKTPVEASNDTNSTDDSSSDTIPLDFEFPQPSFFSLPLRINAGGAGTFYFANSVFVFLFFIE